MKSKQQYILTLSIDRPQDLNLEDILFEFVDALNKEHGKKLTIRAEKPKTKKKL